jgi:hypothetical protein
MKKTIQSFNYIYFFIFISIAAILTGFVYVQLVKDFKNPANNYKESFISIPKLNSVIRPMIRNTRISINNSVNSFSTKMDNFLRKNKLIG